MSTEDELFLPPEARKAPKGRALHHSEYTAAVAARAEELRRASTEDHPPQHWMDLAAEDLQKNGVKADLIKGSQSENGVGGMPPWQKAIAHDANPSEASGSSDRTPTAAIQPKLKGKKGQ